MYLVGAALGKKSDDTCTEFLLREYHASIIEVGHSCSMLSALRVPHVAAELPDGSVVIVEGHTAFATQTYEAFKTRPKAQNNRYFWESFSFCEVYEHSNKVLHKAAN